MSRKKAIDQG